MPTYAAQLTTPASADQAFADVARFDNTQRWDPGVSSADPLSDGPAALGSRCGVTAELGCGPEQLTFEIAAYDPPRRLVAMAAGRMSVSHGEISVAADGGGAKITYRTELSSKRPMTIGAWFAGRALRTAGDSAVTGLTRKLTRPGG